VVSVTDLSRPLLILGTRSLAVEIADIASDIAGVHVVGFVENLQPERCREKLEGLPILWVDELAPLAQTHMTVCGLATTHRSRFTEQVSRYGLAFATLVHPTARISSKSILGEGTILSAGTIVAARTRLGRHVFVNRGALIGHHTEIADYVTVQPGANIAGACRIGEATYIGMGALVLDRVAIGSHSVVGAGAVVTKDVPDNVCVVGVPARIVKTDIDGK
jgi:sugar O-acyltransferase (sialic acid O-acetyltransferase NeuD family)